MPSRSRSDSLRLGFGRDEPVRQPGPSVGPVRSPFVDGEKDSFVADRGTVDEFLDAGALDECDRFRQLGGIAGEIGAELTHVREQCILVRQERFGRDLGGAHQVAQHQIEVGGAGRHLRQRRIESAELAVDAVAVGLTVRLGQLVHVGQQLGEHQPGQRGVVQARTEHVLDRAVGLVAGLTELVDEVPVAVFGEGRGAGAVVAAFEQTPGVELIEQGCDVQCGQRVVTPGATSDEIGDVARVQQHHVVRASGVERPQYCQVFGSLLGDGEREETETVFLHERIRGTQPCVLT